MFKRVFFFYIRGRYICGTRGGNRCTCRGGSPILGMVLYWATPQIVRAGYTHTTTLDWSNALPNTIKTIKEWINITKWTIPVKVAFTSSNDWWKHMKNLTGASSSNTNEMQGLANKCTVGDMTLLVNSMNDFFVSVSADLPRLDPTHRVFDIEEPLPAEFTIEAGSTQRALQKVKCRKATGPDNIPPWMVNNYAHLLAAPVTAIFNSSLREGKLPDLWKTATVIPVPKKHPPGSLENDIRPISLTPILAKAFEGIVLNWVDDVITPQIDERQFGGLAGTGTTDALVEMFHSWCEATDKPDSFVRVLLVDYSKAFDHINHELLITKLCDMGLPPHLVRWMAAFLIDR